ncbi:S41 family peptidase [Sphingomonas sp. OTU376]|uniref:S41 family peptidase n=1 Tax=Sphingomonas sp. OTU376 TaxID=3043863 RepID=UPI00313DA8B7
MFLAFALAIACPAGQLTPEQAREDLELAISAAEAGLPDIHWRQRPEDWARRKAVARAQAAKATSEEELFRALSPLLRGIGEGHLSVARSDGMNCRYRESARLFPLDLFWADNGAFVTAGYGEAADIPPGTQLTWLNGTWDSSMIAEMMQVSPHDGDNRTGVMRDREGRGYAMARWWLRGNEPDYLVELKLPDGKLMTRRLKPVPVSARPAPPADPDPVATLSWVNADTAYLYVPTFSNRRYRAAGADYRKTIQAIFEQLAARGAKKLILDLRDNGGGSEPNESILLSYLVEEPFQKYASVRSRPNKLRVTSLSGKVFEQEIYDADELKTVEAAPNGDLLRINAPPEGLMTRWEKASPVYKGQLAVLAGGYTFSGGAELASMLFATRRGLLVGEEVGGTHGGNTSGYKWELTLPNSGMEIGIPLLAFRFTWKESPENHGLWPQCLVPPRMGEVRVTRDPAYDRALRALDKGWSEPVGYSCPVQ